MTVEQKRVLISGGGIAGLACALALAKKGIAVEVFEQAETVEPIGSGLQLSPNALWTLDQLGLFQLIRRVSCAPSRIRILDAKNNKPIGEIPLGVNAITKYGYPYYVIHRADLINVLVAGINDEPLVTLHMGHRIDDLALHANGITVFAQNKDGGREVGGGILIAADGVWSQLRTNLIGAPPPVYSGLTAWRGMLRKENLLTQNRDSDFGQADFDDTCLWFHPNAHSVSYPVRSGHAVNLVLITREDTPALDSKGRPDISQFDRFDPAKQVFNWSKTWSGHLLRQKDWTRWPLYLIPPSEIKSSPWQHENIVLIGDAAHAMAPFSAQGAAMAIEDGYVLAQSLSENQDPKAGLADYVSKRKNRVAKTANLALKNQRIYHMGYPKSMFRNIGMKVIGGKRLLARQNWLYDWKG